MYVSAGRLTGHSFMFNVDGKSVLKMFLVNKSEVKVCDAQLVHPK